MLRFTEDSCIQCGLCKSTCPEQVITLTPRLDFRPTTTAARILKEETPFCCIRCGKPFGVRSTIERVTAKLEGKHWMFKRFPAASLTSSRCATTAGSPPCPRRISIRTRRPVRPCRTTDDYLREREQRKKSAGRGRLKKIRRLHRIARRRATLLRRGRRRLPGISGGLLLGEPG